jgi:dTDP-4-amino-4,6-dideoxygalactose transaminase
MTGAGPTAIPFVDLAACHAELARELGDVWHDVVSTGRFVGGPVVDRFEADFARYCGKQFCVGVGNGTDAIELTLAAMGIGPGDEVIVPANGFIATPEAVVRVGATPVFADVDEDTHLVTAETVSDVVTPATAAVIVVHLYGQMPDMGALGAVAARYGIAIIEDAAQAHGAAWHGQPAGSFGSAAAFSFYPTKNLGAFGDGGAVVTDDRVLAEHVRKLTNHGRAPGTHHRHDLLGRNSRLDAMQAGVLLVKLPHLDRWNEMRRAASSRYRALLAGPIAVSDGATPVHYLEVVVVHDPASVHAALADQGIECGFHYPVPCHRQPPFESFVRRPLAVSEWMASHILSVPMFPSIRDDQVARVCAALVDASEDHGATQVALEAAAS